MIKILGIYSEMYKEQGGLDIGGQKYQVQFIPYDHKGVQSSAMSALNKLIFEDKVKYIITTFTPLADGWLPVTEQNKVIFVDVSVTPPIYDPKYNYCFEAGGLPCQAMVGPYFFSQMFPNMKDVVIAGPDSQMGHMGNDNAMKIMTFSGMKVTEIFYPASSSDLSSLGTKVAGINPPVVVCQGGGPTVDSLAQKAIYNAGWRGQFFTAPASPVGQLKAVTPPEVLEGQIVGAIPCEFTPCLNDAATDFMARWLAKYNKYEGQILGSVQWDAIRTAMQKAGSTDVDKVADVLHNGLQYSGVGGDMQMIPRMDFGDSRTNGSAQVIYMKKIVKGEPQLIGTFSLADSVAMMNKYYVKK
jgi:branched-chain amino acid transport system substrate-binding protein